MHSLRAASVMTALGRFRFVPRLASALCLALLLPGCSVVPAILVAPLAVNAAVATADLAYTAAGESALPDALASKAFAYPMIVVAPALDQAARSDGRRIESAGSWAALTVSYPASASTGDGAGSIVVKSYSHGVVTFSTTVIVLRGATGSEAAGRRAGAQLLDAMAADLADIEHRRATKTVPVDIGAVFDALGQVGQRQGREVLARDAAAHSLRVSFTSYAAQNGLDITCVAAGDGTVVTIVGDAESPVLEVRKAANSLLAALMERLGQPG